MLDLPRPQFQGTPMPVKLPHLEKREPNQKRPDLLVPKGTVLLSRGKTVRASDEFPLAGDPALVSDGNKEGVEGAFLELGPGRQWVQIDLGAPVRIHAVAIWLYHAEPRVYHDVVVQISDDPEFAGEVVTLFNNDHDNSSGFGAGADPAYLETFEGRLIDGKGMEARYLRVQTNGNTSGELNHFTEIEVWGLSGRE
jgi:hypothetical protein